VPVASVRKTHENKARNDKTPEACAWGLRVVEPLAINANGYIWLWDSSSMI